jgi:FAD/FMN-containing dehydrogenase
MTENLHSADAWRCFVHRLAGRARSRYHPEYSGWLSQSAWNRRDFGRLPEMIVRAASIEDVLETVRFAAGLGHPLSVCTGGHSYAGCFLRHNSILLDVSALNEISVDPETMLARVGPGATSRQLTHALDAHNLAFPTGHGGEVALGGFLLGGGMGINSATWGGMSVFNVEALDLITADGQLRHASATQNPDLFWAARGAGPNAFFVVTDFYLRCYPRPHIANHACQLPWQALGPLLETIENKATAPNLQIMLGILPPRDGNPPFLMLNTIAFGQSSEECEQLQQAFLRHIPAAQRTVISENPNGSFEEIYQQGEAMLIHERVRSDNIVTDSIHEVARVLEAQLPSQPASDGMTLIVWRGHQQYPDAAWSARGRFFVSSYLQWDDPAQDDENQRWLRQLYDLLAPLSTACYINEFDLEGRSDSLARCYSPDNWQRLTALRQRYDPQELFVDVRSLATESKKMPR